MAKQSRNPPPAPLLQSLGDNPQKQREIQELRIFLLLLWERLGGGSDRIDDALAESASSGALRVVEDALRRRADELQGNTETLEVITEGMTRLDARIGQMENLNRRTPEEITQMRAQFDQLRRKVHELELTQCP